MLTPFTVENFKPGKALISGLSIPTNFHLLKHILPSDISSGSLSLQILVFD
jgi:hypothetical protein